MVRWLQVMLNKLTKKVPVETAEASAKAVEFIKQNISCVQAGADLRADEPERWVFAVFYRGPLPARPTPYKLVVVNKDSKQVNFLSGAEADRYRLRGYK